MKKEEYGSILLLVLILLSVLLILGFYLQDHLLLQTRIVHNLYMELKTYYLSQAGIEYTRRQLRYDLRLPPYELTIPIDSAARIAIKVTLDEKGIAVESRGEFEQFTATSFAHFTSASPIIRID